MPATNDQRVTLQPSFVLHQRPYGDTSSLVELFTRDFGRISVVAKGARGLRSPYRSILQPFQQLSISWSGKGEVKTVTQAEFSGVPILVIGERMVSGLYVNELLLKTLPRLDAHEMLFSRYQRFLNELSQGIPIDRVIRLFEKVLLAELGYNLVLSTEADHVTPVVAQSKYRYVMEHGPVVANHDDVGLTLSGGSLLALANETLNDDREQQLELKQLMRVALQHCLGNKTIHTRNLMRTLHRVRDDTTTE